jgi:hypothetical protein
MSGRRGRLHRPLIFSGPTGVAGLQRRHERHLDERRGQPAAATPSAATAAWPRDPRWPVIAKRKVEWGLPDRGRISPEEAAYVREHLDEVQELRSAHGMPLIDPAAPRTKERYGL